MAFLRALLGRLLSTFGRRQLHLRQQETRHSLLAFHHDAHASARHLDSYETALWTATAQPGLDLSSNAMAIFAIDRDTVGRLSAASLRAQRASMEFLCCGEKPANHYRTVVEIPDTDDTCCD
jgi:hypothetical protein